MSLLEVISDFDKSSIEATIDAFGYSKCDIVNGKRASIDKVLTPWANAKENLYKLFGENLILEKEYKYEANQEEITSKIREIYWSNTFLREYRNKVLSCPSCPGIFYTLISESTLVRNCIDISFIEGVVKVDLPDGTILSIHNGSKPMKSLAKIAKAYNLAGFEEFRILHSQALNNKMLKGKLCLSIHPLDFITMSDNNCGWDSCMSWEHEGDYRQGTVEMMNSPCVVIAYLSSATPMHLCDGSEWSNKKWRSLFVVDKDFICNVKNYPYEQTTLTNEILNWLGDLANKNWNCQFENEIYDSCDEYKDHTCCINKKNITIRFTSDYMYNDFCTCDHYFKLNKDFSDVTLNYVYSGAYECMYCGNTCPSLDSARDLVGCCCLEKCYCHHCGDHIYGEAMYDSQGNCYCESCYEGYCVEDAFTDDIYDKTEMCKIYLIPMNDKNLETYIERMKKVNGNLQHFLNYFTYPHIYLSKESRLNTETYKEFFKEDIRKRDGVYFWSNPIYYLTVEDCLEDGLELFGFSRDIEADCKKYEEYLSNLFF